MRLVLVAARDRGWPFEEAWLAGLRSLPRPRDARARQVMAEWLEALAWSRPFFAAAFAGVDLGGLLPPLEGEPELALEAAA